METHILPLGTLLHITAGNMEGLPVFSIVEGLLTGNVNILKLPGNDGGLSMDIICVLSVWNPLWRITFMSLTPRPGTCLP